jgi:hypothetical protein
MSRRNCAPAKPIFSKARPPASGLTAICPPVAAALSVANASNSLFTEHQAHSDAKGVQMTEKKVVAEGNEMLPKGNIALGEGCFGL